MTCDEVQITFADARDHNAAPPGFQEHLALCRDCTDLLRRHQTLWNDPMWQDDMNNTLEKDRTTETPEELPAVIFSDLRGLKYAHRQLPLVFVVAIGILSVFLSQNELRDDLSQVSFLMGPGFSVLFFVLATVTLWHGIKLGGVNHRVGTWLSGGSALVFLLYVAIVSDGEMGRQDPHFFWDVGSWCFYTSIAASLPVLITSFAILRLARLPTMLSGALIGIGAGLFGSGLLQLLCPATSAGHLLMYHGGAVLVIAMIPTVLGVLIAYLMLKRASLSSH